MRQVNEKLFAGKAVGVAMIRSGQSVAPGWGVKALAGAESQLAALVMNHSEMNSSVRIGKDKSDTVIKKPKA